MSKLLFFWVHTPSFLFRFWSFLRCFCIKISSKQLSCFLCESIEVFKIDKYLLSIFWNFREESIWCTLDNSHVFINLLISWFSLDWDRLYRINFFHQVSFCLSLLIRTSNTTILFTSWVRRSSFSLNWRERKDKNLLIYRFFVWIINVHLLYGGQSFINIFLFLAKKRTYWPSQLRFLIALVSRK